jgi:pimeloyl-ACP methyl ester carboxylesterase
MRIGDTKTEIQHHVDALAAAIAQIEAVPRSERTWWESSALSHLRAAHETHRRFLSPERQMLEWSPVGDGRAVEVFGDLTTARHIAVVVPGIMNTVENFDARLAREARDLWAEASVLERETAVVAWLGYDTPELVNAVSKGRAVEYEAELRSLVARLPSDAHVTVIAHSYGTVLAAESASRGLSADDLVLVGSPGTSLEHASEAELEPGAQVFAGVSDTDWIVGRSGWGSVFCPETILGAGWSTGIRPPVSPVAHPLAWVTDSCNTDQDGDVKGLSHGMNPAHEDFGAIEISTEGVNGHSSYLTPDSSSLDAIARIVTGVHPDQH